MKTVCVTIEHRCLRTPDGRIWSSPVFAYDFFSRYLAAFDNVRVIARVLDVAAEPANMKLTQGAGVTVAAVPHYIGPLAFLSRAFAVTRAVRNAVQPRDAVIMRVPSTLANCLLPILRKRKQPYAVEVVGDPLSVYSAGAVKHVLRWFFRWWFHRQQAAQCAGACAASYVTQRTLQEIYPCPGYTAGISSVELPPEAYATAPRDGFASIAPPFKIVTIGSLEQMYKGFDVLIKALSILQAQGLQLTLSIVGSGRHKSELAELAQKTGVAGQVVFRGQLPAGEAVRRELDSADLFVLPSRSEGLPRAMIEAMARALPCIGSTAGGIPELLEESEMVPPGDTAQLAAKISSVLSAPDRMQQMSQRNLAIALEYRSEILNKRRRDFYQHIRGLQQSQD